jgi:hypothetical protein
MYHLCLQCCAVLLAMNPCYGSLSVMMIWQGSCSGSHVGAVVPCGVEPDVEAVLLSPGGWRFLHALCMLAGSWGVSAACRWHF